MTAHDPHKKLMPSSTLVPLSSNLETRIAALEVNVDKMNKMLNNISNANSQFGNDLRNIYHALESVLHLIASSKESGGIPLFPYTDDDDDLLN